MSETQICIALINQLTLLKTLNQTEGIWIHIPNEISGNKNPIFGSLLKKMGKLKGAPDYVFIWRKKVGFIEVKTEKGKLSEYQKDFEGQCERLEIPYAMCRSVEECLAKLSEWGFLSTKITP